MRRRLVPMLIAITLAACAGTQTQAPLPSSAPTTPGSPSIGTSASGASTAAKPAMHCLQVLPQATCDQVATVALAAVALSGWTSTQIWISGGILCPFEACLFDPNQNFPYPIPPTGGQWVASAEIAFAETDKHAGLHIAAVGAGLVPVLIGYRVPLSTWCSGACPSTVATDGRFQLELVLPHLTWKASDPISGTAILSLKSGEATTIYGSGRRVIVFSFDEVGGTRRVDWVMTADCRPHLLEPATPLNAELFKSGAVTGTEPDADFLRSFFADPQIHLPVGTWDITAVAEFLEGAGCSGPTHTMKATERIAVTR